MNQEVKHQDRPASADHVPHGDFTPWEPNAAALLAQYDIGRLRNCRIFRPAGGLDEFLEKKDSPVLVLVGARGTGKTIALSIKAAKLAAAYSQKDYHTLKPYSPWMNVLEGGSVDIPLERYAVYTNHSSWQNIWTLTLAAHFACLIARSESRPEHSGVEAIFNCKSTGEWGAYEFLDIVLQFARGHTESIAPAITALLKRSITGPLCREWHERYVRPILAMGKREHRFTIFVDGIDECLGTDEKRLFDLHGGTAEPKGDAIAADNARAMAHELWLYVQTGFMSAVQSLREFTSSRCRAYGAVRPEAIGKFMANSNLNYGKAEGFLTLTLEYSDEEMARVFDLHVAFTPQADLAKPIEKHGGFEPSTPEKSATCVALFGDDHVRHPRVFGSNESVLQALVRHTFNAPRELVMLAGAAKNSVTAAERSQRLNDMVKAVNKKSREVLSDHIHAVFPMWDARFERALPLIPSNVLTASEVRGIERDVGRIPGLKENTLFTFLYSRGLVGVPRPHAGESLLEFHVPNGAEVPVPEPFEYLALHPALAQWIYDTLPPPRQVNFYNSRIVVGRGLRVPTALPPLRLEVRRRPQGGLVSFIKGAELGPPSDSAPCAEPLFFGIVLAMRRRGRSAITADEICQEIEWLSRSSLIPSDWENEPIEKYVRINLVQTKTDDESHMLKRCKAWLGASDLHIRFDEGYKTYRLTHGKDKNNYRSWRDVLPMEIGVQL